MIPKRWRETNETKQGGCPGPEGTAGEAAHRACAEIYRRIFYEEIAEILDVSTAAVKSRLFRGRDRLRALLSGTRLLTISLILVISTVIKLIFRHHIC